MSHHGGSTLNMHKRKKESGPLLFSNMSMMNFVKRMPNGSINPPTVGSLDDADDMRVDSDDDGADGAPIIVPGGEPAPPKVRKGTPYGPQVSEEVKRKAVKLCTELGPAVASRQLGLPKTTIIGWQKKVAASESAALQSAPPGAAPIPLDLAGVLEDQRAKKNGRRLKGEVVDNLFVFFEAMRAVCWLARFHFL
jgi:hypothetical protein